MQPPFDRFYIDAHKHHLPYIEIATALKLSTSRVYHKRNGNNSKLCKISLYYNIIRDIFTYVGHMRENLDLQNLHFILFLV